MLAKFNKVYLMDRELRKQKMDSSHILDCLKMEYLKDMENYTDKMVFSLKEISKTVQHTESTAKKDYQMARTSSANFKMVRKMDMERWDSLMEVFMKDNLKIIVYKAKADWLWATKIQSITANFTKIKCMAKAFTIGVMVFAST